MLQVEKLESIQNDGFHTRQILLNVILGNVVDRLQILALLRHGQRAIVDFQGWMC